jgi:isoleucyl-tRNA synthetase
MDYKETLNLPKTDFPMRANLAKREPGWLENGKKSACIIKFVNAARDGPNGCFTTDRRTPTEIFTSAPP